MVHCFYTINVVNNDWGHSKVISVNKKTPNPKPKQG